MEVLGRDEYFKAKVSCRSDLSIPKTILERLPTDLKARFKKSCFGMFYNMTDVQFQGQLYLHLLYKQDKSLMGDKLIFHINKGVTEFGPNEFTLITGLSFGSTPIIPESSKFFKATFGRNKKELKVIDIRKAFMDATEKKSKCDKDTVFKLALLWILYGVLLMKDYTSKPIEMEYIHLMDNIEAFESYPWGRVAYDFLCGEFRSSMGTTASLRREKNKAKNTGHDPQFDLHGFSYALQFWAFEVIPCVAKYCAKKVSESTTPRMLRWQPKKARWFKQLTKKCFPVLRPGDAVAARLQVLPRMTPSSTEKNLLCYKALLEWEKIFEPSTSTSRKRPAPDADTDSSDEKLKSFVKKMKRGKTKKAQTSPGPQGDTMAFMKRKIIELEATIKAMSKNIEFIIQKMGWAKGKSKQAHEEVVDDIDEESETETDDEVEAEDSEDSEEDSETEGHEGESESDEKINIEVDEAGCDNRELVDDKMVVDVSEADLEVQKAAEGVDSENGKHGERAEVDKEIESEAGKSEGEEKGKEGDDAGTGKDEEDKEIESTEGGDADTDKVEEAGKGNEGDGTQTTNIEVGDVHVGEEVSDANDVELQVGGEGNEEADVNASQDLSLEGEMRDMIDDPAFDGMAYNPLDLIYSDEAEAAFMQWYEKNKGSTTTVDLSVENNPGADHGFFARLFEVDGWLEMKNLDALLNLVVLKSKKWPNLFEEGWTTVDMFFWELLIDRTYKAWEQAKKIGWNWLTDGSKVVDYLAGRLPRHGTGRDWTACERVFGIGSVKKKHWVLYEIRLKDEEIVVYDSMGGNGKRANPNTLSSFRMMATIMPSIYTELLGNDPDACKTRPNKPWKVTIRPNVPKQNDTASCGVLAVKVFECIVADRSIEDIDPDQVGEFRKRYCLELFDEKNIIM